MATTTKKPTPAKSSPAKPAVKPAAKPAVKATPVKPVVKPIVKPVAKPTPVKSATSISSHTNHSSHSSQSSARPVHAPAPEAKKGPSIMTDRKINHEARKFNEAAEDLVQTMRETYQTIVENTAATQERGVKLAQTLVENGIEELKSQAEATRSVIQTLTQPTEKPRGFRETYQTLVDSAISTQERNVKYAQAVVENGIEEIRSQTESAQALVQALAQQSEKQRQALQTLARESVESYVSFLFAPLSFWQKGLDAAQEAAQEAARR